MTAGVVGKTAGVGQDIIDFLNVVAKHFQVTISVTSGYRDSNAQARAMFDNWLKLARGNVYKKSTLPEKDRKSLDDFFNTAHDAKQADTARAAAKKNFLELAAKTVGNRSAHSKRRAVDVARSSLSHPAHAAILWKMKEVREGNRNDICHFESLHIIPRVTDSDLTAYQKRRQATPGSTLHHTQHAPKPQQHVHLHATGDYVCVC